MREEIQEKEKEEKGETERKEENRSQIHGSITSHGVRKLRMPFFIYT